MIILAALKGFRSVVMQPSSSDNKKQPQGRLDDSDGSTKKWWVVSDSSTRPTD